MGLFQTFTGQGTPWSPEMQGQGINPALLPEQPPNAIGDYFQPQQDDGMGGMGALLGLLGGMMASQPQQQAPGLEASLNNLSKAFAVKGALGTQNFRPIERM